VQRKGTRVGKAESAGMRCVALLALLALAVLALGYPAAGAARAPSDDDGVVLTAVAASGDGGVPVTGIEVLQLALLGIALFLVGARLRVLALRRRRGSYIPYEEDVERPIAVRRAEPAPPGRAERAPPRRAERAPPRRAERAPPRRAERDEWSFPDPHEPAPTGLLPSTASARRRARVLAAERDSAH
jgi:hypothetical protein